MSRFSTSIHESADEANMAISTRRTGTRKSTVTGDADMSNQDPEQDAEAAAKAEIEAEDKAAQDAADKAKEKQEKDAAAAEELNKQHSVAARVDEKARDAFREKQQAAQPGAAEPAEGEPQLSASTQAEQAAGKKALSGGGAAPVSGNDMGHGA